MTNEVPRQAFHQAIMDLHGCDSTWVEAVPVARKLPDESIWEGVVQVFDLSGHPEATRCYAWPGGESSSVVVMLHQEPVVTSPSAAVKTSIIRAT